MPNGFLSVVSDLAAAGLARFIRAVVGGTIERATATLKSVAPRDDPSERPSRHDATSFCNWSFIASAASSACVGSSGAVLMHVFLLLGGRVGRRTNGRVPRTLQADMSAIRSEPLLATTSARNRQTKPPP